MNNKLTPFQIVMFAVLIVVIIIGVAVFAVRQNSSSSISNRITVWGVLPKKMVEALQDRLDGKTNSIRNIEYREIPEDLFSDTLVEALATGSGPDLIIIPADTIYSQENKIVSVPFGSYSEKDYKNTFIESSEIFLRPEVGIGAFPLLVDPLVMFYNRSLYNTARINKIPTNWTEFMTVVPSLVEKNPDTQNIVKSAIAFGAFSNVRNAKEVFLTLMYQAGDPIIRYQKDSFTGEPKYVSHFGRGADDNSSPGRAALNFYVQFANPAGELYSWNKSLSNDRDWFLSGKLATYFGYASERKTLIQMNPNLNFDLVPFPQSTSSERPMTYAKAYLLAIPKSVKNMEASIEAIKKLISSEVQKEIIEVSDYFSPRRDFLTKDPTSSVNESINYSVLISQIFVDPDAEKTTLIIKDMVESYASGRIDAVKALEKARKEFDLLLKQ